MIIEATAESHMLGVRFKPGGAYPFFKFPVSALNDRVIDLDLMWGLLADEVRERLLETSGLPEKFGLLEEVLLKRLTTEVYGLEVIQFAVTEIARVNQFSTIKALSDKIGISHKHLVHQFNKMVGLPPKLLSRIFKFHHMLNTLDPAQPINWAEIAHQCNYYDQAHFNKDFTAFSGLNPTTYLQLRRQFLGQELKKGEDVKFVPIE